MPNNTQKGNLGEKIAINYLIKQGYFILDQNWRFKHLELDIIALFNNTIVVIEVKWRSNIDFGTPETFVTKLKQKKSLIKHLQSDNLILRIAKVLMATVVDQLLTHLLKMKQ